jgi:hypothetical protein
MVITTRLPWRLKSSPNPPRPASEGAVVNNNASTPTCGICGRGISEGEASVKVRRGATTQEPIPPLLPAHSSCFRRELLPKW